MTTQANIITLDGLTINTAQLAVTTDDDGKPMMAGKVTITLVDRTDNTTVVVTANYASKTVRSDVPTLCDFEGDSDDKALYEACEVYAAAWAAEIAKCVN